jgi:adenosine deaminase
MPQTNTVTSISPELAARLRAMPKVEIHVHVEGATDAETFYQIAQRNHVELPASSFAEWKSFFEFRDFSISSKFTQQRFSVCKRLKTMP